MRCPINTAYEELDAVLSEIVDMILDDQEGYDAGFAATALTEALSTTDVAAVIVPADVTRHRSGECADGGLLVRQEMSR